ncbi:MAG: class I SAM-dependent DNA methyltransferase [Armatimonadota bacterium]
MCGEQFTEIAPWYDDLMANVPYESWVQYVETLVSRYDLRPRSVLDLACGTGRVSRILAQRGYEVVGVDGSPGMIQQAVARNADLDVTFYCQRMQDFDLNRQFDLVICLFDSLNYLTDPNDLQQAFCRVAEHLRPGGLFIFDMNAEAAFELDLFTQSNLDRNRKIQYAWRANYNRRTRICEVQMRFRVSEGTGRREFHEVHRQRCYSVGEVRLALRNAGLNCLEVLEAFTLRPARKTSDRIYFVARRDET